MDRLKINNFKSFKKETDIDLSSITINVGMNSVGKSTVIQSLLLVRQTFDEINKYKGTQESNFNIRLNGPYDLQLGTFNQIIANGQDNILISLNGDNFEYSKQDDEFSLTYRKDADRNLQTTALFSPKFYYLNAERLGPRNYQSIGEYSNKFCGYHGEYTFEVLEKNFNYIVPQERRRQGDAFTVSTLPKQVEYWMDYIAPGIAFDASKDTDSRTAKLRMKQTVLDTDFNSPYNFGFGISYLLPIIVTGLAADKASSFIVENPEAHLHPAGQSKIGFFLAQMAHAGVQIVLETHSEHVVNGIRLYALKNAMSAESICINYFTTNSEGTSVQRIPLNDKMDIMKWPEGFFDQEEKDLQELRHLRRNS